MTDIEKNDIIKLCNMGPRVQQRKNRRYIVKADVTLALHWRRLGPDVDLAELRAVCGDSFR